MSIIVSLVLFIYHLLLVSCAVYKPFAAALGAAAALCHQLPNIFFVNISITVKV